MAESKFLKYQDKNNDGLIDICETDEVKPVKNCPPCQRKPSATVPEWKKRETDNPWFNEKYCLMQCTVVTTVTNIMPPEGISDEEHISSFFEANKTIAIDSLLDKFNKAKNTKNIEILNSKIQNTKYDLGARPGSVLKLLYSVPVDDFSTLDDFEDTADDEEENSGPITVKYNANHMFSKLMKFRKAMNLYSRYYRVYQAIEGGLYYFEDGRAFTTKKFEKYGDAGFFVGSSIMADILKDLDNWLNDRDYNIFGVGSFSFTSDRVEEIEFTFSSDYKLEKLKIWTVRCGNKSKVFKKSQLTALNNRPSFKDPTALAYFTKLNEMESHLSARTERPWTEFVEKYTYPKLSNSVNNFKNSGPTALSCVGDALLEEGKQLGQDILDDVFSIGDAIAYAFHKSVCKKSLEDIQLEKEKYGLVYKTDPQTGATSVDFGKLTDPKTGEPTKITEMAISQAFETLEDSDQAFVQLCAAILSNTLPLGATNKKMIEDLWTHGVGRVKLCGLTDMMIDAVQCLFKGLTLEQALRVAIKSALDNMAIQDFGQLFIGLPPEKQAEMDALVRRNMSKKSKVNLPDRNISTASDAVENKIGPVDKENTDKDDTKFFGSITIKKPWEDEKVVEEDKKNQRYGNYGEAKRARQSALNNPDRQRDNRTLAQKFDKGRNDLESNSNFGLNNNVIMEAYALALIDTYGNDLLSLVDELNKFPGAQIIAKVLVAFDCPRPPLFDPSFLDFIKSIELPFCRNTQEIKLPMLSNPLEYLPDLKDITKIIYEQLLLAIQKVILSVVFRILVKICELIGDAICKALEVTGDLAASLPAIATGRKQISDVIKNSICGEGASDEQVDATIAELFQRFGVGGAALSDTEAIKNFLGDLSSATTTQEILDAYSGNPSQAFADIGHTILVNQYPQFADAMPNKSDLTDLFSDIGKVFPAEVRSAINDYLEAFPELGQFPANPTLCATPESLDDFADKRCILLEGRATPAMCADMFSSMQDDMLEDLEQVTQLLDGGISNAIEDALGPLVSDPGCDNGLVPFETESTQKVAATALSNTLEQLKIDYSIDMLGNGGIFATQSDWGFMNMILSDTHGRALSTHRRQSSNRRDYVDFFRSAPEPDNIRDFFTQDPRPTSVQIGAYPSYVAEQLFFEMKQSTLTFESDNTISNIKNNSRIRRTFEQLGFNDLFGPGIELVNMPDFGYDTRFSVDMENERILIKKGPRKRTHDVILRYRDNNDGLDDNKMPFEFGVDVKMFMSEVEKITNDDGEKVLVNKLSDNVRISIVEVTKDRGDKNAPAARNRQYEFLSIDDTFDGIDLTQYENFLDSGRRLRDQIPQVLMLGDMLGSGPSSGVSFDTYKTFHDSFMTEAFNQMFQEVAGPADSNGNPLGEAWQYGAKYDDLTEEDLVYVVASGQTDSPGGTKYSDAELEEFDEDGNLEGTRSIDNDDMILGISKMQLEENRGSGRENRVFYLDPKIYGGSYKQPSIFIKPLQNSGWLGMVDVMFPDIGPCKPQRTDLVDFGEISDEISNALSTMPEDQRLKSKQECVVEKPYNRILERASKAGIQGIIKAACRIYSSVHFIKAYATFSTFDATIKDNYSSMFASYIVARMAKDFKDATIDLFDVLTPFSDQEFWYAFLEQAVQTYGRLVDDGIIEPPAAVLQALGRINNAQEDYRYPYRDDLKRQKELGRVEPLQTLKSWRNEKNLETVQATQEDAYLILKEFVIMELTDMASKFNSNLKEVGFEPRFKDMGLYFMNSFVQGAESLDADKELKEEIANMPIEGGGHYTTGGELTNPDGTPYIGYYHIHENEDGNKIYMVGERHNSEAHEELTLSAQKVIVPIGDIDDYNTPSDSTNVRKPFVVRKYISINGRKLNTRDAVAEIKENDGQLNISDVYPGTLQTVHEKEGDPSSRVIGLAGELGVRYGLEFSVYINGNLKVITSAEIDALDLKINQMGTLSGDSKLLLCLVNNLKDDEKFKLLTKYIFPLNKITSMIAIYNDYSFLPAIGQITVDEGDTRGNSNIITKPGASVYVDDETGVVQSYIYKSGWAYKEERERGWSFGFRTWDEWDKILLRNSKRRIKKLFKTYYNSRDFDPGDNEAFDASKVLIKNLKSAISLPPGQGLVPWWKRNRIQRNTPFDANGQICTKKE